MTRDTRRKGFTLIELMVVIAIVATLMGLLLPAVLRARETGRRTTCINNQYQLAFAAQRHAESAGTLVGWRNLSPNPANTVRTANSIAAAVTPSWPVPLLPFIERGDVYAIWAQSAVGAAPQINTFLCPSTPPDVPGTPRLAYVANAGSCGAAALPSAVGSKFDGVLLDTVPRWNGSQFVSDTITLDDISSGDGTATTLLFSERAGATVQPGTWDACPTTAIQFVYMQGSAGYSPASAGPVPAMGVTGSGVTPVINNPFATAPGGLSQPSSQHPDGVVAAFCDGHTVFLKATLAPQVYAQLITSNNAKASAIPRTGWATATYALSDNDYQ